MSLPYMKWYPTDYRRDTALLSRMANLAYRCLLERLWELDGYLPLDMKRLARLVDFTVPQFTRIWPEIEHFFVVEDGQISSARVLRDLKTAQNRSKTNQKSAEKRWKKESGIESNPLKQNEPTDANAYANAMNTNTNTNTIKEEKIPSVSRSSEAERHFDEFWDLYPRKQGKGAAKRKFLTVSKTTQFSDLMDGLRRSIDHWEAKGTEPQFIPLPATWLNQGRWEDELGDTKLNGHKTDLPDDVMDMLANYNPPKKGVWE